MFNQFGESWFDIEDAEPEEIRNFPDAAKSSSLIINRCLDAADVPGVISYDKAVLLEFPIAFDPESGKPGVSDFSCYSLRSGDDSPWCNAGDG